MKFVTLLTFAGFSALFFLNACNPPEPIDYQTEIKAATDHFEEVYATGNTGALVQLYSEDAWIMPPGQDTFVGREAIKDFFGSGPDSTLTVGFETLDVFGAGEFATEVGKIFVKDSGGHLLSTAKYVVVWKKVDGTWLIYRDSWNADAPLEAPNS